MAVLLFPGFDFRRIEPAQMVVTEATGSLSFGIRVDETGWYYSAANGTGVTAIAGVPIQLAHIDINAIVPSYFVFATILKAVLEEASDNLGNSWTYTVTFSVSGMSYSAISATGNTALTFNDADFDADEGIHMRRILGFNGNSASAASHQGSNRPFYSIAAKADAISNVPDEQEPSGMIQGMITDDGEQYSVEPTSLPVEFDFELRFESDQTPAVLSGTPVHEYAVTSLVPWSWQHFYRHARGVEPFAMLTGFYTVDSIADYVLKLRYQHAHCAPVPAATDWQRWHLMFKTLLLGRL